MAVFRIERNKGYTVMSNFHLKDKTLSLKAKGLLSMCLSLPDEWQYSVRGLAAISKEGAGSIGATIRELEATGYIIRNQLRDSKGRISDTEYVIYEQPPESFPQVKPQSKPRTKKPDTDSPCTENPYMDEPSVDAPRTEKAPQLITKQAIPKKENIYVSTIQSINLEAPDAIDSMDRAYRELIMDNVEYECLIQRYGRERMDEVVELVLETVLSKRQYIRIAGDEYPREVVKSRFLKLNSSGIEYVFDCLDKNTTKVRNIKAYLLAALYNAPATMDSYYRAEVNHDLYGGD